MSMISKRTSLVHHIAYMGIMSAINLIFILLATYFKVLMFLPIIFLTFASAIVSYECKKRYYIIYAVASIGLCLIFNITDTIFYVVPAVITGFVIGLLLEKQINPFWMVLCSSLIETVLTFAFIPLIDVITNGSLVDSFLEVFHLTEFAYVTELKFIFIYFIALVQCSLSHFVLLSEAKRMGIKINTGVASFSPYIIGLEISILLSLSLSFLYLPLALTFMMISFYFGFFLLIDVLTSKKVLIYIILVVLLLASFFGFAALYNYVASPANFLIMNLFPISIGITCFINNCLPIKSSNNIK